MSGSDSKAGAKAVAVIGVIVVVLLIIGALNWGWLGLTGYNVVGELNSATFQNEWLERSIYILVGVAGVIALVGAVVGAAKHKDACRSVLGM